MIRSLLRRAPVTRSSPRTVSSAPEANTVCVLGKEYRRDDMTNVTSSLLEKVGRELHNTKDHPINLLKKLIVHHFHKTYTNNAGNPLFTSIENIPPVVTTEQNFDSLCVSSLFESCSKIGPKFLYYSTWSWAKFCQIEKKRILYFNIFSDTYIYMFLCCVESLG